MNPTVSHSEVPTAAHPEGTLRRTPPPAPVRPNRTPFFALLGIILLVAAGLLYRKHTQNAAALSTESKSARTVVPQVFVVPMTRGDVTSSLDVTGTMVANHDVLLNPKLAAHVAQVLVTEGQHVSAGQLVVQLDATDLHQQVLTQQANLDAALVKLQQARVGLPAQVAQINNAIVQAQAALSSSRARYQEALLDQPTKITTAQSQVLTAKAGVASSRARVTQARDTARLTAQQTSANVKNAQAGLSQAQAALQATIQGNRTQQIASAQAQAKLYQAQVDDAQTNLRRQNQLYAGGATAKANVDQATTQLAVAQAQLENAEQNLSLEQAGSRSTDVQQAQQTVAQRQATLLTAESGRTQVLVAQSQVTDALAALAQSQETLRQAISNLSSIPITRQGTLDALSAVQNAQAALQQAQANRANIPVQQANIPAAQAAVDSARAALQQAELNESYTRIVSPIDGVVNAKSVDVGQTVSTSTQLLEIVSLQGVYFEAQIPEAQLTQIHVGQPAKVFISGVSNGAITGVVTDLIPVADVHLRQFRVRIGFPSWNGVLTPGAFARGTVQTQVVRDTLFVANDYLRNESGQSYLLVVTPHGSGATVHRRNVVTGISTGSATQIVSGVRLGDLIVASNESFEDGDKVTIAKGGPAT